MKYDLTKKPTIGAMRTLQSLRRAMLSLLSKKSFEEISVGNLCEISMLPRATFYNYFEDKYDLLSYCFHAIRNRLDIGRRQSSPCLCRMYALMENCFDFLDGIQEAVQAILKHNPPDGYLISQIRYYLLSNMSSAFAESADAHRFAVPIEMAAKLYSEAILIIVEQKYIDNKECTKEQAREYLHRMVRGIDLN